MNIKEFYVKLLNVTDYITAMNLDDSETSIYNRSIEFNLCILRSKLWMLKESMSRLRLVNRLIAIYNVHFGPSFITMLHTDMKDHVATLEYWAKFLPSPKKANFYDDQITHIQTEWAKLKSFIEEESWTLPMN